MTTTTDCLTEVFCVRGPPPLSSPDIGVKVSKDVSEWRVQVAAGGGSVWRQQDTGGYRGTMDSNDMLGCIVYTASGNTDITWTRSKHQTRETWISNDINFLLWQFNNQD